LNLRLQGGFFSWKHLSLDISKKDTDTFLTWVNTITTNGGGLTNVIGYGGTASPQLEIVTNEDRETGLSSLRIQGRDNATTPSYAYFQAFDVNIPVSSTTKLEYSFLPKDANGRFTAIDMVMADGSTLRDSKATTTTGLRIHPGTAKGTIMAKWKDHIQDTGRLRSSRRYWRF
jgi:hypothetical protein